MDGASGGCALASNNAINNAPEGTTGNVNLSIPANAFNGTGGFAATVCADVLGNKVLQSRTIKAAYDISVSSGGVKPDQDLLTTVMTWTPNGYQGLIPYISTQSAFSTICIVSNKSTASATLTVDILSSQSGASLTRLSGLSLGSLAGQGTMRVDFASQITPYTFSGGVETPGTPIALTGLADRDRYSALINAGASPTVITINCIQNDPAGSKRMVPVLTQTSASNPFQQ